MDGIISSIRSRIKRRHSQRNSMYQEESPIVLPYRWKFISHVSCLLVTNWKMLIRSTNYAVAILTSSVCFHQNDNLKIKLKTENG